MCNLTVFGLFKCLFSILNKLSRHLSELRNLYLHNNKLEKIEGLSCLKNLTTLNLSSNAIGSLHPGSLSCLPNLHTLLLSRNKLRTAEDIEELLECTKEVKHLMIVWWHNVKRRSFQNCWISFCITSLLPFWALSQFFYFSVIDFGFVLQLSWWSGCHWQGSGFYAMPAGVDIYGKPSR